MLIFVCFISLRQFTHEMFKKTTEALGPQSAPTSKKRQVRRNLKICISYRFLGT